MEEALLDQLACLSHPQRMAIFRLLTRRCPDALPAGEIAATLGLKPSTASVYLAALTRCGLLGQTRKGTSLLYRLDLEAARGMVGGLFLDCCRGRPDLCPPLAPQTPMRARQNVLFLCSGNSARSIMAEAILRHDAGARFNVYSAGTAPAHDVNPAALKVLGARRIDTNALFSKHISAFQTEHTPQMDFVITVCDRAANEDCPTWPGPPIAAHWGLPDPAQQGGTAAFEATFEALSARIARFTALPFDQLSRPELQRDIDTLAKLDEPA